MYTKCKRHQPFKIDENDYILIHYNQPYMTSFLQLLTGLQLVTNNMYNRSATVVIFVILPEWHGQLNVTDVNAGRCCIRESVLHVHQDEGNIKAFCCLYIAHPCYCLF